MAKNKKKVDPICLEFAQQHMLMLLLLLLFFGVLVVPRFHQQVHQSQFQKVDGIVKTIYYSQYSPILSFVEISYNIGDKEYNVKETLQQHVQVGDHIEIYVNQKNKKSIQFEKQNLHVPLLFLIAYFVIFFLCVYKLYTFFTNKKKKN